MNWKVILHFNGYLLIFLGVSLIFPLAAGLYYHDDSFRPLLYAMATVIASGAGLVVFNRPRSGEAINRREGMVAVALGWTAAGVAGALPFYFGGVLPSFTDALFESVSGFTTTGASVLTNIEGVSKGYLFWRSFIHWLGGMGIIVLSLAILPLIGVGGMELYKAEVPGPMPDKLQPRIKETAKTLWKVYIVFTLCQIFLLKAGGMSLFDCLCHTFATMATGGFSTRNLSIGSFNSAYIDGVIILFMMLAGINFTLHYRMLKGEGLAFWKDAECRFFLVLVAAMTLIVTWNIYGPVYATIGIALRHGAFQVVSIITTTGFATADFEVWPGLSQLILFLCMFIGASAGSTTGAIKCIRVLLCLKYCYRELFSLIHPKAVSYVKIVDKTVPDDIMRSVMGFLSLYMLIFIVCSLLLGAMGIDAVTSATAVATTLGNVGPGFGTVGPLDNFFHLPAAGKWVLTWCMLLGRLEIYTLIILLVPEFWRK
ncbi:MAG: potassium transporter TrkG [Thermodesulfobacteriota bacterium]